MTDQNKIADKIRKLLRLSEGSDEHEAANALAQAQRLAAEYHLDMQQVAEQDQDPHELAASDVELWSGNRDRRYRWQLAWVVAEAHGCAPWTTRRVSVDLDRSPDEGTIRQALGLYSDKDTFTVTEIEGGVRVVGLRDMQSYGRSDAEIAGDWPRGFIASSKVTS